MTMPPLPLPDVLWPDRYHGDERAYSADAMRAYAEQAVAAAQQRKPLSDDALADIITSVDRTSDDLGPFFDVARAVERAHEITGEAS